jgi:hypothetical protein
MKPLKLMNPVAVTKGAFGLAGTAVGVAETLAETVVRGTVHVAMSGLQRLAALDRPRSDPDAVTGAATAETSPPQPQRRPDLPVEPHAPEEPPVDVVGEALAAEAALGNRQSPVGAGFAHEPRGASRDEEHGDAPLQRAETEGIDDEVTAALEGDEEPEEHLTEPVLDPAQAQALAAEMEASRAAVEPDRG